MLKLRMLWSRVKGQGAQSREDEAFDEEIREHIALLEERYTAQGMSAAEGGTDGAASVRERDRAEGAAASESRNSITLGVVVGRCGSECACWPSAHFQTPRWCWRWRWESG